MAKAAVKKKAAKKKAKVELPPVKKENMVKLFLPTIGTKLRLTKDWTFKLHDEHRNYGFLKALGFYDDKEDDGGWGFRRGTYGKPVMEVTLPKNIILLVKRIYIRQGKRDFDSLTFSTPKVENKHLAEDFQVFVGKFFWSKLGDANTIVAEIIE
jgi:hypothetical protein